LFSTHQPFIKIGNPFIKLLEVDSTNNYALALVKENKAIAGSVIYAKNQTSGKGQMGKTWMSKENENITISVIIDISSFSLQNQFLVSAFAAIGCYDFFKKYAGEHTAIKWPNDIYFNDKKAGGILIETVQQANKRMAIIGIGMNINQKEFFNNLPNPISLHQITNEIYEVEDVCNELIESLNNWLPLLYEKNSEILKTYNQHLYKKNKAVQLKKDNIKFTCLIKEVNAFGELMVEQGLQDSFQHGEIEWILD
jgi:BirA family transcriptional regulator, biotin operon repressor / biotin---[acetyl-CoA-carboxylase] ligase